MSSVALHVGGKAYAGWKSLAIERSIESISGSFQFDASAVDSAGALANDVMPGARAKVLLDGATLITGYIDEARFEQSADDHSFSVRGRDAAGDLVDCAAISETGQFLDQPMLAIARALLKPFGMAASSHADLGAAFETWNIEPGESVHENLDRMARHRGVLVVSDGLGGILFTKPTSSVRAPTSLVMGENILQASASVSHADRYSQYLVLGQGLQMSSDDISHSDHGVAKDGAVRRYRPKVEMFEDTSTSDVLQRRAEWRRGVNAGRGTRVQVTVQGWRHAKGLWEPNTLVSVDAPTLRLAKTTLLITGVRFTLDTEGTRTELSLAPRSAFNPEVLPEDPK